jgi:hypothetical protein
VIVTNEVKLSIINPCDSFPPSLKEKEFPVEKGAIMAKSHDEMKERVTMREPNMKKPYSTPELIVHGAVEKITEENKGRGQQDGGGPLGGSTTYRSR